MDVFLDTSPLKQNPTAIPKKLTTDAYLHQVQKQHHTSHARTQLEHVSNLDIDHDAGFVRQTGLGCTLGELWNSDEQITAMIKGGMNVLRLNLSMGSYEYYSDVIRRVRAIERALDYKPVVAIAFDISAPPMRTGVVKDDMDAQVTLKTGQFVKLSINPEHKNATSDDLIFIDTQYFPSFMHCISQGDRIHLDDGMLTLIVRDTGIGTVNCLVEQGGFLGSGKRVDLPSERVYQKTFETTYMRDLAFAVESKVDYVFTGYSSNRNQLLQSRAVLGDDIKMFAKVETKDAVKNLNEIMMVTDGIIVGRNGLGLVYPTEKIFQLQKQIIAKCNILHKPVFVIAQLLESMRFKPRATRAEITDVANAVLDGADGLILTVETSRGLFPREALRILHKTCREAESAIFHERFWTDLKHARDMRGISPMDPAYMSALAAVEASSISNTSAIFVVTTTGHSASAIAAFRPSCPVVAIMRRPEVARLCHSFRGIHPFVFTGDKLNIWSDDMDARLNAAMNYARDRGFVTGGDQVVVVTGWRAGTGATNTVRVLKLPNEGTTISIVNSQVQMSDSDLDLPNMISF